MPIKNIETNVTSIVCGQLIQDIGKRVRLALFLKSLPSDDKVPSSLSALPSAEIRSVWETSQFPPKLTQLPILPKLVNEQKKNNAMLKENIFFFIVFQG